MLWLWLLIFLLIFILLQSQSGFFDDIKKTTDEKTERLNVIDKRYASGDMDTDEYRNINKNLMM